MYAENNVPHLPDESRHSSFSVTHDSSQSNVTINCSLSEYDSTEIAQPVNVRSPHLRTVKYYPQRKPFSWGWKGGERFQDRFVACMISLEHVFFTMSHGSRCVV